MKYNLNNINGLYNNPEELESNIITVGELNNLLGNNIALLKIIDVEIIYNYPPDNDNKSLKGLKCVVYIYIKVLTTKETYYLKIKEELSYNNPTPATLELFETLIKKNKGAYIGRVTPKPNQYQYLFMGFKSDNTPITRFNHLIGLEFLVTGLGITLDPRVNDLSNLILLDGVPSDYKKIDLE